MWKTDKENGLLNTEVRKRGRPKRQDSAIDDKPKKRKRETSCKKTKAFNIAKSGANIINESGFGQPIYNPQSDCLSLPDKQSITIHDFLELEVELFESHRKAEASRLAQMHSTMLKQADTLVARHTFRQKNALLRTAAVVAKQIDELLSSECASRFLEQCGRLENIIGKQTFEVSSAPLEESQDCEGTPRRKPQNQMSIFCIKDSTVSFDGVPKLTVEPMLIEDEQELKEPVPSLSKNVTIYSSSQNLVTQGNSKLLSQVHSELFSAGGTVIPIYASNGSQCPRCSSEMVAMKSGSMLGCKSCYHTLPYIKNQCVRSIFGEDVECTFFSYKREGHFKLFLNCVQNKESTRISPATMHQIMAQLVKDGVRKPEHVTKPVLRKSLKHIGLHTLYKHEPQIMKYIVNKRPLSITTQEEDVLKRLFSAVIPLYLKYKPKNKRNFITVNNWLYKFCEFLGWERYKSYFTLLKANDKNEKHDKIWKQICADPDWECIKQLIVR